MKRRFQIVPGGGVVDQKDNRIRVNYVEEVLAKLSKCCGVDCCENVIRMKDKSTGNGMVGYFFDGNWVVENEAAYKAKKENGDFNY